MPSTASTTYQDFIEGKLITAVGTGTTTGVQVKLKQIGGVTPTAPTAAVRLMVVQKTATNNKVEKWGVAAGSTQSGQTWTLGTLTRALPLDDGTDFTGSGTAESFAAGADVFLTWDSHDAAQTVKKDLDNTFTGTNTFSGAVVTSNSFKVPVYADATARDAAIVSPANGMIVYLTDQGALYQFIGGAWSTFATGTTSNGSTTVAGKFEEATVAEQGTATATGATGARLVPAVANLVKASSGSGDENKIPVLGSGGTLVSGFLPNVPVTKLNSGTNAGATTFWRGDGAWAVPASDITQLGAITSDVASGNINSGNTTVTMGDIDIAANSLAVGDVIHVQMSGAVSETGATDANSTFNLRMGTTNLLNIGGAVTDGTIYLNLQITVTAIGASGAVSLTGIHNTFASSTLVATNGTASVDTTTAKDLNFVLTYVSGTASTVFRMDNFLAYKVNA